MLACICLSMIGVIYYLRKSSLVGEVISHSAFPGLIIGAFVALALGVEKSWMPVFFVAFAMFTSYLSMKKLSFLQKTLKKSADASLMISISSFLGVGILLASIMQSLNPVIYKELVVFLYGRSATMLQIHLYLYCIVTISLLLFLFLQQEKIKMIEFDKTFVSLYQIGEKN